MVLHQLLRESHQRLRLKNRDSKELFLSSYDSSEQRSHRPTPAISSRSSGDRRHSFSFICTSKKHLLVVLPVMSSRSRRGPTTLTYRSPLDSYGDEYYAYLRNLLTRINRGYDARRDSERRYEEDSNSSVVRMLILFSLHPVLLIHPVLLVHSNEEHENEVLDRDLATPPPSEVLKVAAVEFYVKQNAQRHHTDDFELVLEDTPTPILRRGQEFYMAIKFANKEYNSRRDILRLAFGFGPYPSVPKGTKVILPVRGNETFSEDENKDTWDVRLNSQPSGRIVTLVVKIPSSVPVGVWKCTIECGMFARQTVAGGRVEIPRRNNSSTPWKETFSRFECKEDIYILFNPWIKDDPVYMDNDIWRKESVLNDTGKIWIGNYKKMSGRQWVYGQFDDAVLPATMMLLELSNLNFNERGNPIKVARAISAVVNSNDDEGLVVGRWDGKYDDGTAPYMWTGSVKILEEFLKTGKPVKYGQCWVFAGVTTTICRALGIPCRAVTNFVSAHDTDGTLTVDKYFDLEGEPVEGGPSGETFDSIWNFHVWNDVWISRSDLPQGYGGWQAIDATPQERSGGGTIGREKSTHGDVSLYSLLKKGTACHYAQRVPPYKEFAEVSVDNE
ncbi:unnamed protein product [Cyprideis torosa]|uniref:Uncharacterized protein n=1 Tax=Cyprideis torosa TaxID=163714 RepID=A0A7R8ZKD9_9CRUS|nr:unnamed protein product [Cyprideis torosa]CAG0884266.1 unnamed protein product [Cyprideis torosa]